MATKKTKKKKTSSTRTRRKPDEQRLDNLVQFRENKAVMEEFEEFIDSTTDEFGLTIDRSEAARQMFREGVRAWRNKAKTKRKKH